MITVMTQKLTVRNGDSGKVTLSDHWKLFHVIFFVLKLLLRYIVTI